jgi:hypothetical protein
VVSPDGTCATVNDDEEDIGQLSYTGSRQIDAEAGKVQEACYAPTLPSAVEACPWANSSRSLVPRPADGKDDRWF